MADKAVLEALSRSPALNRAAIAAAAVSAPACSSAAASLSSFCRSVLATPPPPSSRSASDATSPSNHSLHATCTSSARVPLAPPSLSPSSTSTSFRTFSSTASPHSHGALNQQQPQQHKGVRQAAPLKLSSLWVRSFSGDADSGTRQKASSPWARPQQQPLAQHKGLAQLPPPPPVPQRRVVVTGIGLVTPLGVGASTTWQHLIGGKSAIRALTPADIAIPGMTDSHAATLLSLLPSRVAGLVPPLPALPDPPSSADAGAPSAAGAADAADATGGSGVGAGAGGLEAMPRFVQHAVRAADEAMADARWMPQEEEDRIRTGVCMGGGIGSTSEVAAAGHLLFQQKPRRISPHFVPRILINMAAGHISIRHRLKGPNHAAVTACASSAHAIADAFRLVRCGAADVIVAGGTEACVDALSLAGFSRMGEGAGVLVLEDLEHAVQRGARMYAEIRGAGSSADAFHITQPSPLATGAVLCMRAALKEAGLEPSDIGYLNAHATSTPLGDEIEALALKTVFEQHALSGDLAFSSSKGALGHLLGAAGAVEAAISVMALQHAIIPPNVNLVSPDPVFRGGFLPAAAAVPKPLRAVMSNSFGFGGTNASLVFALPPLP